MSKQSDDKFYIMASTVAHIGEALETISQPEHWQSTQKPLRHLVKSTVGSLIFVVKAIIAPFNKKNK